MPAAIRTISSSTIPQGVGFQVERKPAPRRPSSGPVCYAEWKIEPGKAPEDEMQVTILLAVKQPGSHHSHTTLVAIVDSLVIRLSSPTAYTDSMSGQDGDPEFRQCASPRPLPGLPGSFSRRCGVVALRRRTHRADAAGCSRLSGVKPRGSIQAAQRLHFTPGVLQG
jgi:hypothetical protein